MKLLGSLNNDKSYVLFSYEKCLSSLSNDALAKHPTTEIIIMVPGEALALPKGLEEIKPPVEQEAKMGALIFAKAETTQPQRRQVKKTHVPQVRERPTAIPTVNAIYNIEESNIFSEQRNLLASYYGKAAEQTLSRIEHITNDIISGRLPSKSVEHYYVADLPALSRSRGRGEWRLLITRHQNVVTLYAIADYHKGAWKQWG